MSMSVLNLFTSLRYFRSYTTGVFQCLSEMTKGYLAFNKIFQDKTFHLTLSVLNLDGTLEPPDVLLQILVTRVLQTKTN